VFPMRYELDSYTLFRQIKTGHVLTGKILRETIHVGSSIEVSWQFY
jgi:hypothetical protein